MNGTMVSEDNAPFRKLLRPVIRALRTAYIQGTTVVKLMPSERAIQLYYKYRRKSYDLQWAMDPGYKKGLSRLIDLTVTENDRVLDVGCGTGSATVVAALKAIEVVGIDLSPDMIELAEEKVLKNGLRNTRLYTTSVEDYSPSGQFDKVISSFMIPHVKPHLRPSIYSCMFNFLKPGGLVGLFASRGEVCDVYETREEIESNLTRAGFADIELHDLFDIYRIALARKPE
ncbi:MAG TPA: class I SAM-dependent methyltransferase [Desulfomonilaceae bacterium]|nr:class I SAM-dependent methyltransferase [Desulfomonilaceae bacterium]